MYFNLYKPFIQFRNSQFFMAKCPYCKGEVSFETIEVEKKGIGFIKQEIMYVCPHCKSILGLSRGKWTGQ